ncbi:MAG: MOSC domain-containing protein [Arcobacter sp.]|jgi:MOSC domain-containing protein YiiM|uniref:MOSC domain-containing protein n=1 Tax=Arcobacter sp. TaxID=1872629 RepID=UPI002588479D|nr:MOSC domain-containing protein [Arcobacter sp.]MDD3008984.1 MOSC domain-containing protein [Arcobacter sp.]MDY3204320.1 MOSC domain-containing protein [Arcobacter sp.]
MKNIGKVLEIFSATKESSGLPRPKVKELNLIENFGIENDKFAGKKLEQTVMIVGLKSYEMASEENINLEFGSLGENILLDFDPHNLEVGTNLIIGEAIIEITQVCTVCNHLSVFDKNLPQLLKAHRGLYCKIIKSGFIFKDMEVKIKG